ncbi:MAG: hypothetical protein DRQ88_04160 [Epsilonproteobacteria bacterium]|nr:MAG: hypothetical protein DRQ89_00565 [Campylobacterota bacterium]RLA67094.1 MAG: hypothetical protein DRQ88_04160 [Campylobacterota bacterium]
MKILVNCILLYLFSSPLYADVATCVEDYNKAVKERNNAKGSYQMAMNYKKRAESYEEKKDIRALYTKSLEWVKVALANLLQAEKELEKVKIGGCPATLLENVGTLTAKGFSDQDTYDKVRLDLEKKLSLLEQLNGN